MASQHTLDSFEYQWRNLPTGPYLLSDPDWRMNVTKYILDEVGDVSGWRVLDAGCGSGRWAYGFDKLGCEVVGVDASPSAIEYAQKQVPNGHFITADLVDPSLGHLLCKLAPFDLIFCWGVLHHTSIPAAVLANLTPQLARDGLLHLYVYGHKGWRSHLYRWVFNRFSFDTRVRLSRVLSIVTCARTMRFHDMTRFTHGIFDAYSPPIAHEYTESEIKSLFANFGLKYERVYPAWAGASTDLFVNGHFSQN